MGRNRKVSAVHKALNHVLQGVSKEDPKDQVCSLYNPDCLPCFLTPFLPHESLSSSSIPTSQVLSPKSRVTPMGSITDSQNKGEDTEVKTVVNNLQLLFKLFVSPSLVRISLTHTLC